MKKRVERPGVSVGYDLWSETYDRTPNPLVALDRRHTMRILDPKPEEYVLDAACGTGCYLDSIASLGGRPVGLDFSRSMLRVARRRCPKVPLVYAHLEDELPFPHEDFDAVLCSLVGEHLDDPAQFFRQISASLKPEGRFVFSVFHPELACAGIEANFEQSGVEYRLGAQRHSVSDYVNGIRDSGFQEIQAHEYSGDIELAQRIPSAGKYVDRKLLLVIEARRRR